MKKLTKAKKARADKKVLRAKQIAKARKKSQLNVCGIDQATLLGIAWQKVGEAVKHELWDLSINTKASQGVKWIKFEARIREFFKVNDINIVAYELPAGRNINPIIHSSKLIGIIEKVSTELGIEYVEYSASTIKSFATGNGNAGKPLMLEYAKRLWGYKGEDDNEADALHILHYLKSEIN